MSNTSDLILRNGLIIDGTGGPAIQADIAVVGDRITGIGQVDSTGATEVDVSGLTICPGFIDVHTHDDFAVTVHPDMAFKVLGGVTTVIVGNCGFGAAPYQAGAAMARAFHPKGEFPVWDGYSGYRRHLERESASVNVGMLIGHGTVRLAAMGSDRRPPAKSELDTMRASVIDGLDAGALGISTGLIYEPGRFANTDELVALSEPVAEAGGLYASHLRNEASRLVEAVDEAIEIGERAGLAVQISHHKASGRENWGDVARSLARIEQAQARGLRVRADQYPYTAGSTVLRAVTGDGMSNLSPDDIVVASCASHRAWEGMSLARIGAELGCGGPEAGARVLEVEPDTTVILHLMAEDDVQTVMAHPSTMIGSDGIPTLEGRPHPRLYGTFARVLGHYARDLGVFPIEEAVYRMTGYSADTFGLHERGVITEGNFADLVVFDPATIIDVGTYEDPNHPPAGIDLVVVNGRIVVRGGHHTGARPGRPLTRAR